ncbi:hypothetical protein Pmani_039697 [Petrolisthes manimaculis]|uniref:Uncharacterized protein n=1 Tax=Petrolisthes manimaculis TaxID=1843537 RepID=A0AAE1NCD9_9EUCA|nr:hypothetical protein Pmani_039697 [Petrolisthes manimaculis]
MCEDVRDALVVRGLVHNVVLLFTVLCFRTMMSTTASSQQKLYPMFMPNEHQKKHIFRLNTSVSIITPAIPPVTIHHLTFRPHWHFKL